MRRRLLAPLIAVGCAADAALVAVPATVATASTGCAPNGGSIPAHASTARIPDRDGDGRTDAEYFTEALPGGGFDYGILTASGHLATLHETLPGPGDHGGWTARIVHGTVITVVDDHRSAKLFGFTGCAFHATRNAQGRQYTFSIAGYVGPGTGVACSLQRGGLWLYGEQATRNRDETWRIERTNVVGAAGARSASTGVRQTVATHADYSDHRVQVAFTSSCGSVVRVHSSGD